MSFKLTYATMFDPPEELHQRFEAAMARVSAGLGRHHPLYIDGKDREAAAVLHKMSPANQQLLIGEFAAATRADAEAALRAAQAAYPAWRDTPASERARLLRRAGELIEERVYDIAAALTLEVGKNRMEALGEAQEAADFFQVYCDEFEREHSFDRPLPNDPLSGYTSRNRSVLKPYGVWAVITPFNFPIALAAGPTAAALITGNTVVLKGATATPWAGRLLADALRDAGLPAGVFNYLSGSSNEIGAVLVDHPITAGVTFTGSYEVGRQISVKLQTGAYSRPCIAEMGGKNACIVSARADLTRAAAGILRSGFGMGGQKCSALSRLYVDRQVADELIEKILAQIAAVRIGDPARRENWLGPVATRSGYDDYARYTRQLRESGARILSGGEQLREGALAQGLYVRPTLAEAEAEHPLWQKEMFLPIVMLKRVASNDEAMALANASPLGLTAGFYGASDEIPWFQERIEAGVTYANRPQGATTGAWPGYQAFGGWKGSGSTGKAIGSFYYLPQYLREQSQTVVE
ncbi:MAG: aldehyde dehydrogenase family protein [Gammaproteobacteria bacterium]|nr:aldehyde dehydrogenase family protein [Gammaproteobacteria bacterium]MBV8405384.1 aldehyde dehydrogenase family protein [Gammaproteobacteria bacterium]